MKLGPWAIAASWVWSVGLACAAQADVPADATSESTDGADVDSGDTSASQGESSSSQDTGSESESSESSTDETTGQTPTAATVYVAMADGGWLASSCDGGHSWTHTAFSDEIGDHTAWTAFGGLAYGEDAFVAGFGWGEAGSLVRSRDGITWEPLADAHFINEGDAPGYASWTSAVVHTGDAFVAYANRRWLSDDAGLNWVSGELQLPPGSDQVRQMRAFPDEGLVVAALESQSGQGHPVGNFAVVSEDGGATWTEGSGFDGQCAFGVQHHGDIEVWGDSILIGASGLCRSDDRGATWSYDPAPTGDAGVGIEDLFVDDQGLGLVAGSRVYRSLDGGANWSELADVGGPLRAVVWSPEGYVGVSRRGDAFYRSDDGVSWSAADTDWVPAGEVWVRDLGVGELSEALCEP